MTRSRFASSPPRYSWPRLIYEAYNKNPVGSFAGNFDKPITLNIRCGNTILTFREFVEFRHDSVHNCQQFKVDLEEYHKLNDVSQIKLTQNSG